MTLASFHCELIRQLLPDHEVHVVSSGGRELDEVSNSLSVQQHVISMSRSISLWADLRALVQWIWLLWHLRPVLLISATPKASLLAQVAAWVTRVPRRVYFLGGLRLEGAHGRARALLVAMERLTIGASTVVVANSYSLRDAVIADNLCPPKKLRVTSPGSSHGVDSQHFSPQEPNRSLQASLGLAPHVPVVGFIGRLTHDKGIDTLIEAIRRLEKCDCPIQWLIVGQQIEPDSKQYVRDLETAGAIFMVEAPCDVRPYLALMDVHVLPSLREGFPNVVLEASAMGVPTITTNATGAVDSVRAGKTGIVIGMRDGMALADAVLLLIDNEVLRFTMGQAAREWVTAEFVPSKVVASLLEAAR